MRIFYITLLLSINILCISEICSQTRYGGSVPNNAISNVAKDANIELFFFDGDIQNSSVNANNIIIRGSYTGIIPGSFSNIDNFRVTFNPSVNFKPGETISIEVTERVLSSTGQPIEDPEYSSFMVATSSQDPAGNTFYARTIDGSADGITQPFVGDINKDGLIDIMAAAFTGGSISWYRNEGGNLPTFTKQTIFSGAPNNVRMSDLVDINRDGYLDFFANINSQLYMFLHDGNTTNPSFTQTLINSSIGGWFKAIDLN